jgi:exosortase/archaeosortase family protein
MPNDLSPARSTARVFGVWMGLAGSVAFLPVVRAWQLTGDTDITATTLAVFAGAAVQFGGMLRTVPAQGRTGSRLAAVLLLGAALWQLGWIGTNDFWFFRLSLPLIAAAWLMLAWGLPGLLRGWRILTAFLVWGFFCDGPWQWMRDGYQSGEQIGPGLAAVTAGVAGRLLAICGAPVTAAGSSITWAHHTVKVGLPCTALPLAKLLLLLLLLTALLLRLPWRRSLWLGFLVLPIAFCISVVRVMILAYVVRSPALFHYWHDPEGAGGGWFTAAGMLALAFLIARQCFRQRAGAPPALSSPSIPAPIWPGWVVGASLAAWLAGYLGHQASRPEFITAPLSADYRLVSDQFHLIDGKAGEALTPNVALWTRHLTYDSLLTSRRIEIVIAAVPLTFDGDPRSQHYADEIFTIKKPAWFATVVPREAPIYDARGWDRHLQLASARQGRWLAWWLHRRPFRDKWSFWLAGIALPPPADALPPKVFSDWTTVLAHPMEHR